MARHRDEDMTRPDGTAPQGAAIDDDPILDRPDPLGLGGTPPPDAPSRSPKPRIIALLGEFFRMSRTTAILLGAFVLAGVLYLLVRDEPVVAFGPQPAQDPTGTSEPAEPAEPVDPSSTPTDQTTDTTAPTSSSPPTPTGTGSRTTGTTVTGGTATTGPDAEGLPGGADQQSPQQQQPQQSPQQQPDQQSQPQLQQEAPGAGETSVPGGALEG
ncbi:hypothetical protein SAMN06265174_10517 [Dietzia kunjamensis subsp. schimae]|uniref:Uncharacterized protein n=2 Tax=Dietzia kunjamensis TaxID=322509 RepID=A0ABY1N1U2_9ACTN|nr:hypothetical protein SAMN06265174_10517 [Dietzia kunjamensis subsp. schimae]